jgi:cephalosporin hydroxylase
MVEIRVAQAATPRFPGLPRRWSLAGLTVALLRAYNAMHRLLLRSEPVVGSTSQELREIREFASAPSDIDEHLELIFTETLLLEPKLIVELGVRGGTSTFVFERAANLCGASIVSVDIDDCSSVSPHPRWHFFQGDDVQFADVFPEFCRQRNLPPSVDLLFIDTSHYYDHTVQEIAAWFPHLSSRAKVMLHDTNMRLTGLRRDGCFQSSWDNQRGVIRAVEEYLGMKIDESKDCVECAGGWVLRHKANCNGLTILDKLGGQVA